MSLRILHLAPLWHAVRSDAHGGIETFLADFIGALNKLGHSNDVIAASGAEVVGNVIPAVEQNLCELMTRKVAHEYVYYEQRQLGIALQNARNYDVIHSHVGPGAYVLSSVAGVKERLLHTHHGPVYDDLRWFVSHHPDLWISTVSEFQLFQLGGPGGKRRVVNNGVSISRFTFNAGPTDSLFFMGRIEPQKGPDIAVDVARTLNAPIDLAGPIIDRELFASSIKPHLDERIRYIGVLNHEQKNRCLGGARCVLMPSRWNEPFGLVAIEAMACGTPVVGLANGALPEIIDEGVTGFVTKDPRELPRLVEEAFHLDRSAIRRRSAERFDIAQAAAGYEALYTEIAQSS
jgi:glycosyltransferase involved in cell wall biosynthesis